MINLENSEISEKIIYKKNNNNNLFDETMEYIIPLYQREFAWTNIEIEQLIEDINYVKDDEQYFLGSLILYHRKEDNKLEVIDGQQRLTALFLLLKSLKLNIPYTIDYECRKKANYTLRNIDLLGINIHAKNNLVVDYDKIDKNLEHGKKIIETVINKKEFDKESFISKLAKVKIYAIRVPENTDLNQYFEIMNIRGEQLEQQDILKASLMEKLLEEEQEVFSDIWDACSDMTGYVQMHFNRILRERIFGANWNEFLGVNIENLKEIKNKKVEQNERCNIQAILQSKENTTDVYSIINDNEDKKVRFRSIISYPYFLLHTLKAFVKRDTRNLLDKLLDDKELVETFEKAINIECKTENDKREFSREFIMFLLKARYVFDKYIVKREYFMDDEKKEDWSLKELKSYGQNSNKKPEYINTKMFGRNENVLMLQACLRVSYTSPKIMHWITESIKWLVNNDNYKKINAFENIIEDFVKSEIREYIDKQSKNGDAFKQGIETPHILLNYLDYLLGKDNKKEYYDFKLE